MSCYVGIIGQKFSFGLQKARIQSTVASVGQKHKFYFTCQYVYESLTSIYLTTVYIVTFWLKIYIIIVIQNFFFHIPVTGIVRYLGKRLHPLAWLKRTQVNTRYRMLLRLLDTRPHLTVSYKLLIHNKILKPTWNYRLENFYNLVWRKL